VNEICKPFLCKSADKLALLGGNRAYYVVSDYMNNNSMSLEQMLTHFTDHYHYHYYNMI